MINVVIVDDHPIVLKGLIGMFNDVKDIQVIAAVNSAELLFSKLNEIKDPIDVIILDFTLPQMNGYDAMIELHKTHADIKVLMLSAMKSNSFAEKMLAAGAKGFLKKESAPEDLVNAVRIVAKGHVYRMPIDSPSENKQKAQNLDLLSEREMQVLLLLGAGKSVSEIAEHIFLSVKTISTYRARLLDKLNLKNNNQIIKYCLENKMV